MSLDTADKIYIGETIEVAIERALVKNNDALFNRLKEENDRAMGAYTELVRDDIKKVMELVNDKPGREEVRHMIREEARPIVQEEIHRLVMPHFKEIHKHIATLSWKQLF